MGDLSLDEAHELVLLGDQLGIDSDLAFELIAAAIEVEFLQAAAAPLPANLAARLHQCADALSKPPTIITPQVPAWQKLIRNPLIGWAAAAAIAIFAVFSSQKEPQISPAQAEAKLRTEARDLIERKFAGLGAFKNAGGKVVWSDKFQQGHMTLTGIPVNDPKKAQYQLWIVDPKREDRKSVV